MKYTHTKLYFTDGMRQMCHTVENHLICETIREKTTGTIWTFLEAVVPE